MKLRYDRRALEDIEKIRNYIAKDDPVAARNAINRIERSVRRLTILPLSARPGSVGGTRLLAVPGLPYIVVHRVRSDIVEIIAVLHTARRRRS